MGVSEDAAVTATGDRPDPALGSGLVDLFDSAKEVIRHTLEQGQDEKLRVATAQDVLDRLPGHGKKQTTPSGSRTNNLLFVGNPEVAGSVLSGLAGFFGKFVDNDGDDDNADPAHPNPPPPPVPTPVTVPATADPEPPRIAALAPSNVIDVEVVEQEDEDETSLDALEAQLKAEGIL